MRRIGVWEQHTNRRGPTPNPVEPPFRAAHNTHQFSRSKIGFCRFAKLLPFCQTGGQLGDLCLQRRLLENRHKNAADRNRDSSDGRRDRRASRHNREAARGAANDRHIRQLIRITRPAPEDASQRTIPRATSAPPIRPARITPHPLSRAACPAGRTHVPAALLLVPTPLPYRQRPGQRPPPTCALHTSSSTDPARL